MAKSEELLQVVVKAINNLPNQRLSIFKKDIGEVKDTYHLASLIEEHLKELNEQPLADSPEAIDRLAQTIREVDGNHDKGAAELAEAILSKNNLWWRLR